MKELTKSEETVLIAVWKLRKDPYGVNVQQQIETLTGKELLYSTLYTTLEQLVRKGYLSKGYGEPTAVRGGKRKIFFKITPSGLEALRQSYDSQKSVWEGINEASFNRGVIS